MAFDSTTFASDFADLFGAFAQQQKEQNENIVSALEQMGSNVGAKKGFVDKAKDFANEAQEKYLGGRPKTNPRQVKKSAVGVIIEDVSKKAALKLSRDQTLMKEDAKKAPETKMGLLALLGGILGAGAVGVIGSVFGMGAGAGAAAGLLSKIGPIIFKPLKLILKRLPIIGSLFSFYEAYENFKKGGVDNILLGLLDVAAGFAYAFPGVGTAIGLGIDVLSYFINKQVEEHNMEGGDTSWLGSMYDKVIDYLSETDQIKWMVKLGELFGEVWDDPGNLDTWEAFFTHIGGLGFGLIDMLTNFDKTVGTALGVTDEKGEGMGLVAKMVELLNEYVVFPIVEMITKTFKMIKNAISDAASAVYDKAAGIFRDIGSFVTGGAIDDAETAKANKKSASEDLYDSLFGKDYLKEMSEEQKELYSEIHQDPTRREQYRKDEEDALSGNKGSRGGQALRSQWEMKDFAVIGGEVVELPKTAILAGGKVQAFSGSDTIIGFKEGEALLEGMKNLISVGQQQLTVLQEYLSKDGNNIIAPNTNNTSTYNFSVESGVSSFRKMVS